MKISLIRDDRPRKINQIIEVFLDKMLRFQLKIEVRGLRSEIRGLFEMGACFHMLN